MRRRRGIGKGEREGEGGEIEEAEKSEEEGGKDFLVHISVASTYRCMTVTLG